MATISMRAFCETLYCAYAPSDALAVGIDDRIAFVGSATDAGGTSQHRVVFDAVRDLTWHRETPTPNRPAGQIEFSVIELERELDGWRVWLNPWYVEEVEFRCTTITLDGAQVTGEGRWLQDDLRGRALFHIAMKPASALSKRRLRHRNGSGRSQPRASVRATTTIACERSASRRDCTAWASPHSTTVS